jgi:hypothetical protein
MLQPSYLSPMARAALGSAERAEVDGDRRRAGSVEPSAVEKAAAHSVSDRPAGAREGGPSGGVHTGAPATPGAQGCWGETVCAEQRERRGTAQRLERRRRSASLPRAAARRRAPIDSMQRPHGSKRAAGAYCRVPPLAAPVPHAASAIGYALRCIQRARVRVRRGTHCEAPPSCVCAIEASRASLCRQAHVEARPSASYCILGRVLLPTGHSSPLAARQITWTKSAGSACLDPLPLRAVLG